jgi:hypothetical protein
MVQSRICKDEKAVMLSLNCQTTNKGKKSTLAKGSGLLRGGNKREQLVPFMGLFLGGRSTSSKILL